MSASIRHVRGRAAGTLIVHPKDGGREVQRDTVQCVHCSYSWVYLPGSGRIRGWCWRCHGIICGQPCCEARGCVSLEQELVLLEQGIPWERIGAGLLPVSVSVPFSFGEIKMGS